MLTRLARWLGFGVAPRRVPPELWSKVEAGLPFLAYLDDDERERLRTLAQAFLECKEFDGADGLLLTDEMLVGVALQACLPILNIGLEAYQGWVGVILYPGDFIVPRSDVDDVGVVHEYDDEVLGEAWENGPVLLSGFDGSLAHGVNVVIHEFAHKLDMANGVADGFPPLPAHMSRQAWSEAFSAAYDVFCAAVDAGEDTEIDAYGSEHPAEFFAVSSETFFIRPAVLREVFPAVYAQLSAFYGLDPAQRECGLTRNAGAR